MIIDVNCLYIALLFTPLYNYVRSEFFFYKLNDLCSVIVLFTDLVNHKKFCPLL